MSVVDKAALIGWLNERAARTRGLVQGAVYLGLVARVERGDFDVELDPGIEAVLGHVAAGRIAPGAVTERFDDMPGVSRGR